MFRKDTLVFGLAAMVVISGLIFSACSTQQSTDSNLIVRNDKVQSAAYNSNMSAESSAAPNQIQTEENSAGERYAKIEENPFLETSRAPLSTFSIDVDTASYANVRRFINSGSLPPADAVRIEELINYFEYDYPQPAGSVPFSVNTETASCPWNQQHKIVSIGLQGNKISLDNVPPSNLVFLIDTSGSMNNADKLPLLKESFRILT